MRQQFDVLFVFVCDYDHREIFAARIDRLEESHSMRSMLEINDRKIEVVDFPAFIVVDDKGNDFFEAL